MITDLQRAIQSTIRRELSAKELHEAECNLIGLFDVLVAINRRERLVDTTEGDVTLPPYEN